VLPRILLWLRGPKGANSYHEGQEEALRGFLGRKTRLQEGLCHPQEPAFFLTEPFPLFFHPPRQQESEDVDYSPLGL